MAGRPHLWQRGTPFQTRRAARSFGRVLGRRAGELALALLLEGVVGYPDRLWRAIGHPVSWVGALLGFGDRRWNDPARSAGRRRACGGLVLGVAVAAAGVAGGVATRGGMVVRVAALASLLATRSLHDHVARVAAALERGGDDLRPARKAVAAIVGRDTAALDRAAIARAAIESLAENLSDGVVAPALFFLAGGLPGAAIYKAVNTADSMIGHRTARHEAFGWAAARVDDLLNGPASRASAVLLALASGRPRAAWRVVQRDARGHRSPNAGWPEAAMAGALGVRLNGPRRYGGVVRADRWTGDGRDALDARDVRRALALYRRAVGVPIAKGFTR